jgi:hypothetical protein
LHEIVGFMKEKMNAIDYKIFMDAPHNQSLIGNGGQNNINGAAAAVTITSLA